ncbi:MAG: lytic transglycosylase domain-containing protein [Bacteriovoracaceae bacterium]|jgi:membrane-bound lytic murein transglycosylase D|nr:lytic transglycosylase domain-containing protein [Bacteriovoracaceae bacterium]
MEKLKRVLWPSLFLISDQAIALSPENIFQNDHEYVERVIAKHVLSNKGFEFLLPKDKFKIISLDPKNKVNDVFNIPGYFSNAVHFWFNVYTLYNSNFSIIHDKNNLSLVYKVLDYTSLLKSVLNHHTKVSLMSQFTLNKVRALKKSIRNLSLNINIGKDEKDIKKMLIKARIKIPKTSKKRTKFYNRLAFNMRAQTGQKNNITQGIINFSNYRKTTEKIISIINLPEELLAIPFLESSYNVNAVSKVGAAGVWQFMPRIARHFMSQSKQTDMRLNPLLASVAAFHLLKQNKQILKRWDLGITAYNSGTKHIVRARKKFKKQNLSLQEYIERYKHPHIGFATKNFYSEYLALVYALAYQDELFDFKSVKIKSLNIRSNKLYIYVTKCRFVPNNIYYALRKSSPDFKYLNLHLKYKKRSYPRGTLLVSDIHLTSKRYLKVSLKNIKQMYPKYWKKLVRNYSCSTK